MPTANHSMRAILALVFFACAPVFADAPPDAQHVEATNRIAEDIPEIPAALSERLQPYQSTRRAGFRGWLANGQGILISTRFGETSQVHWVQTPGGARQQLTFYTDAVGEVAPNPIRNGFAFGKDVGGSESWQLYYFDLNTRSARLLTDGKSENDQAIWSNRGDRLAFSTTMRNGSDADVHVVGLDGAPSKAVLERSGTWDTVGWSPDDSRLLVSQFISEEESRPCVVELDSGKVTELYDPRRKVSYRAMKFARDGKGVFYTSNETGEFSELRYRDLATGTTRSLTASIPWDVEEFAQSKDGSDLAFVINQDGVSVLHLLDLSSGREIASPTLPVGVISSINFSPDGMRLGFVIDSATSPGDVYSIRMADGRFERWTVSEVGGLDAGRFVEPTLLHYPTFDKVAGKPRTIPALYYKPRGDGPFPVVIHFHGGPASQSRPEFDPQVQSWVNELGIAVLEPNVRGSTGYGKTYTALDNGYKREDAIKDVGALLDWVAKQPELDARRVGVHGGSYGGYMTLATMTHFSERLRAGAELVGQSNFVTFLEHTASYRRDLRRVEFGDERDPKMRDFLQRTAPVTNAAKINRPLFVAQGANDPRVPEEESRQIVDRVRANGNVVWYLRASDEGHGFRKRNNEDYLRAATALFWQTQLLAPGIH